MTASERREGKTQGGKEERGMMKGLPYLLASVLDTDRKAETKSSRRCWLGRKNDHYLKVSLDTS